jgi:putative tryptophan/tyrosine transport system substrate-binding protein
MRRREFMILSSMAVVWPKSVAAQQSENPVIGFISLAGPDTFAHLLAAYHESLREAGFVEGRNVAIEYRWARGQYDQLPALATDLVRRKVSIIVASGGDRPSLAAKAATSTIPIVFTGSDDPVGFGLVQSLSHPGGNMTGTAGFTSKLEVKKLEILHEVLPEPRLIGMLANPKNPAAAADVKDVEAAARSMAKQIHVVWASNESEIDAGFAAFASLQLKGLLLGHDPFFNSRRDQIIAHVTRLAIPAIYEHREFILAGGLMSYGTDIREGYRLAGSYTGRILKGAKPADLPTQQPTKFNLIINLKAAKALNFEFPASILGRADEIIE